MKFIVQKVCKGGARLGLITDLARHSGKDLKTPLCMVYTRMGSAPYLAFDVLKRIDNLPSIFHIPLSWLVEHEETVEKFPKDLANFCGLQGKVIYCSIHNPGDELKSGYNDVKSVAVWSKGGKRKLTPELYARLLAACRPDMAQTLCDADTGEGHSEKRANKSVVRSLDFLSSCLEQRHQSAETTPALFGSAVGGYSSRERKRCGQALAKLPLQGYVLDGFHHHGPSREVLSLAGLTKCSSDVLEVLPSDQPRVMHDVWAPHKVFEGLELGVDMFDSCYPYIVTERGAALVFSCDTTVTEATTADAEYELRLSEDKYSADERPVMPGCPCYTCTTHSRMYINHLLKTQELLAPVLLMIHNFRHYFLFFEKTRTALEDDMWEEFKAHILQQRVTIAEGTN